MGKRCRSAAWGATFALLVAACTATESQTVPSTSATAPDTQTASSVVPSAVSFPESLADASFVLPELPDGPCAAGDASQVALYDSSTGEPLWSFAIPRPDATSVVDGREAFVSFRWDRDLHPGIVALDIEAQAPLWQRFLPTEVEEMISSGDSLIVTTADNIRAIDKATGDDIWIKDPEFDFADVALGQDAAYALDNVGVRAIDYTTGAELWQLPIDRADSIRASDTTLAVAAGTRLIGVDVVERSRLFDIDVTRLGAGDLWVFPDTVAYELAPSAAPGGGVAVLDRNSGIELWRAGSIGEPTWTDGNQLISSTANDEPPPAPRFVLTGRHGRTGEELWRVPATAQVFDTVVGVGNQRILAVDPHPAIVGVQRVRLIDELTGEVVWSSASLDRFDESVINDDTRVTLFSSSAAVGPNRGRVARTDGATMQWSAELSDGIAQPPVITAHGTFVISGEQSAVCVSRSIGEPDSQAAVLGATVER